MSTLSSTEQLPRETGRSAISLVEEALHILDGVISRWTAARSTEAPAEESASIYRQLALLAEEYRDYLVRNESGLPDAVLKDLLIASAELDGLCAAYGRSYHDRPSRRNADRHLREIKRAQERARVWVSSRRAGGRRTAAIEPAASATKDLRSVLTSRGPLPPQEALQLTHGILKGVANLHRAGIVHGDITPENVLIGASGEIFLADIGEVAESQNPSTLAYAAPEQVVDGVVTPASDLYSVALVLYELLTARLPSPELIETQRIAPDLVTSLREAVGARILTELEPAIARALKKNPEQRFGSAREMDAALPSDLA